ncbi:unnamed protein product [Paramecium primaurelia]|uniref:MIF4G domain-containing protein n=1 Tax=Paramecium primaurelia TaxID=5886 RepID=A0A8S1MDC6_PARPR|nr:unnamed protein product [Paramecium primaurelia]
METQRITATLSIELKQKYQEIEEMQILKENLKKFKLDANLKPIKQEKVLKLCEKIKDADSNRTTKKKYESVLKEIREYDLTNSLQEIATTIVDCQLNQSNIKFFFELCVVLGNYKEFSNILLQAIIKHVKLLEKKGGNYENEDKRAQKRKNLLRICGELYKYKFFPQQQQLVEIFKLILPHVPLDQLLINIQVMTNFMNHFGYEFFGKHKYETRQDFVQNPDLEKIFNLTEEHKTVESTLKDYIQYIEKTLIELYNQIQKLTENQNDQSDNQKIKEMKDQFIKLKDNYRIIKDCMGEYDPTNPDNEGGILNLNIRDFQSNNCDDTDCFLEEERKLYCQLITINNPPDPNQIVVQQNQKQKDCSSIEISDQMALEFVNTKQNRKKLLEEMQNFKQNYTIVIPYQCRLFATLCKHYKEFEEEVIKSFLEQYKQIKSNDHQERKQRYLRYLCELTKFKILKQDIILDILSQLLEDLISYNVDMIALILNNCGRFLKYSGESYKKFEYLLNQLDKQRKLKPLAQKEESILTQALLSFDRQVKPKKEKSELQKFIKFIIFDQLDDFTNAFESMERLPLSDQQCKQYLIKQLFKISIKGRYSSLSIVACLLATIKDKYPDITGQVVDSLLDDILCGLEDNNINKRQRRITIIKMIGELYAYQIIDQELLFKLLYLIIEFGHASDIPQSEQDLIDPPEDSFRINQVIGLVESVREYHKQLKTNLLKFLVYFQRYVLSKRYLPQIVEFSLLDLYEMIDPRLARIRTINQAEQIYNSNNIEDALARLPDQAVQLQGIDKKFIEDQKEVEQQIKLEKELEQQFQQQLKESQMENQLKQTVKSNKKNILMLKGSGDVKVITKLEIQNTKKSTQVPNQYVGFSQ